jgi:dUTP pyrophosphatase
MAVRGMAVGAGVIDADYRGSLKVLLFNHSTTETLDIQRGDRIAQLVLEAIVTPEVQVMAELPPADRGAAGFGSTGK